MAQDILQSIIQDIETRIDNANTNPGVESS